MPSQFKNIEIQDTGYLTLPSGTSSERPASPESGMIRYNTDLGRTEWYDSDDSEWKSLRNTFPLATGGTVVDTEINGRPYRLHYFTETGTDTLTVTAGGEVEYLIVAGGGGGGGARGSSSVGGAGGGAGGLLTGYAAVSAQSYSIIVGEGGSGGPTSGTYKGSNGDDSSAFDYTAIGGGAGGAGAAGEGNDGNNGGSGGGAGYNASDGSTGGSGVPGQGNDGGDRPAGDSSYGNSGAGGAGSPGEDATNAGQYLNAQSGDGIGLATAGYFAFYAGGGGAARYFANNDSRAIPGGLGGGGGGGEGGPGFSGSTNTGGGGGGGARGDSDSTSSSYPGGDGGSGIVIVRYPRDPDATYSQPDREIISSSFNRDYSGLVFDFDAQNPVCYPGSGSTSKDLGKSGNTGTINGATFQEEFEGYFSFNDNNEEQIDFGDSPLWSSFGDKITIESYVRSSKSDYPRIIAKQQDNDSNGGTTNACFQLGFRANGLRWSVFTDSGGSDTWSGSVTDNEWHHCVGTYDGSSMRTFVDGEQTNSDSLSGNILTSSKDVYIGASLNSGGSVNYYWDGDIAFVKVYNRGLSETEIKFLYNLRRGRFGL